jgi:hypothetical protein
MSKANTDKKNPTYVRPEDFYLVAECNRAVDEAMERFHERNPAGYHRGRPSQSRCRFDPSCPFTKSATE